MNPLHRTGTILCLLLCLSTIPLTSQSRNPAPGTVRKFGGIEFVWIPAGEFLMGDTESHQKNEKPVRRIRLKGFWLSRYEITQGDWKRITDESIGQKRLRFDRLAEPRGEGSQYPMVYVSWLNVQDFCGRFREKTGVPVRLPTEAEWEYASRARSTTAYYWGDEMDMDYAWIGVNSEGSSQPVGGKKPNAWGLYDMSGNVYEWCQDWYGLKSYKLNYESNPAGPANGLYRVIRGGSFWNDYDICLRSAYRFNESPHHGSFYIGFRLVREGAP